MSRRSLAVILSVTLALGAAGWTTAVVSAQTAAPKATTQDQQAMDKLLAPIALYPDALLAQVLACSGSPQQVTEVNKWLKENSKLTGSDLQQAAGKAGFDASFVALVLFPDVLGMMGQNMEWTTELGKAFGSNQKAVLESIQRLRAQAKSAGNLKTTPQQEVKTETQNGQTVIIVQPANPQVVYVPQYDPQTAYTAPPPAQASSSSGSGKVAAAAVIGFVAGVALGAAMDDDHRYYGYSAWGMSWHGGVVVVGGGAWHYPPGGRYVYPPPPPYYRPPYNVAVPRYSNVNVNINVNRSTTVNTVNRQNVNVAGPTPRPVTYSGGSAAQAQPTSAARPAAQPQANATASRGRAQPVATTSPAGQIQRGSNTSAFGGYQKGSSEKAASSRGRTSARAKSVRKR